MCLHDGRVSTPGKQPPLSRLSPLTSRVSVTCRCLSRTLFGDHEGKAIAAGALLRAGAVAGTADSNGVTAVDIARSEGHTEFLEMLYYEEQRTI